MKWEDEFKKKERWMRSMSEFPQFYEGRETQQKFIIKNTQYKLPDISNRAH